jgi:hypothetical protein
MVKREIVPIVDRGLKEAPAGVSFSMVKRGLATGSTSKRTFGERERQRRRDLDLGFGRIVASEIEAPNMLANLV